MPLKIIEHFDSSFTLALVAQTALFGLLRSESFLSQLSAQIEGKTVEFTELLFQPVPYTTATPKGMPSEFEKYHADANYIIINVPPNFMFQAKIFKPSRLCAVYRRLDHDN